MKILLVADIHSNLGALRNVLNSVEEECDVLICVGDFTDFGPVDIMEDIVSNFKMFLGFILCVPGNCDPPGVGGVLASNRMLIAGKHEEIGGHGFYGVGGGTGGPYAVSEEDLERVLRSVAAPGGILISHMPPKGVCDGEGRGSDAVRKIVEEFKPGFVLCGHVHEAKGSGKLGESIVVNPGTVCDGNYAIIDLEAKSVKLEVVKDEEGKTDTE